MAIIHQFGLPLIKANQLAGQTCRLVSRCGEAGLERRERVEAAARRGRINRDYCRRFAVLSATLRIAKRTRADRLEKTGSRHGRRRNGVGKWQARRRHAGHLFASQLSLSGHRSMLNKIWFGLLCIGLLYGFCQSGLSIDPRRLCSARVAAAITDQRHVRAMHAKKDVKACGNRSHRHGQAAQRVANRRRSGGRQLCIGLIGIMALWLGMMNIAKDAGMVDAFARLARPLMRWLFPDIPDGHPAQGAILMNLSANMLGMDNAATPMGLKAMEELQTLNPSKIRPPTAWSCSWPSTTAASRSFRSR